MGIAIRRNLILALIVSIAAALLVMAAGNTKTPFDVGAATFSAAHPKIRGHSTVVITRYGHRPTRQQVHRAMRVAPNARGTTGNAGVIQFVRGCRRFTVANMLTTTLGRFAGEFSTFTDYCFRPKARKALRIYKVRTNYYTRSASFFNFRGLSRDGVSRRTNACHHKSFQQGAWTNDIPGPWPAFNTFLTSNMLVVSCLGTAHFATDDLARP